MPLLFLRICSQDLPPDLPTKLTTGSSEDIFEKKMKNMVGLLGSTPEATFYESYSLNNPQGFSCLGLSKLSAATEGKELLEVVPGDDIGQWSGQTVAVLMTPTPLHVYRLFQYGFYLLPYISYTFSIISSQDTKCSSCVK